jgi:hypothetical protein
LLGVEAQMVRIAEGLLENEAGLFQVTGPRQALDIPKRAGSVSKVEMAMLEYVRDPCNFSPQ